MTVVEGMRAVGPVARSIIEFIEVAEEKLGPGTGSRKLEVVLEFAKAILGAVGEVPAVVEAITLFVTAVVSAFNRAGIFRKLTSKSPSPSPSSMQLATLRASTEPPSGRPRPLISSVSSPPKTDSPPSQRPRDLSDPHRCLSALTRT